MKKIAIMFTAAIMFAACNGGSNGSTTTDSVAVDSVNVVDSSIIVTDSTTSQIPADSTAPKPSGHGGGGGNGSQIIHVK